VNRCSVCVVPLLALLIAGCVPAMWFDRIDYFNMEPRLTYKGFSFDRPPNPYWYVLQHEQYSNNATLRRDLAPRSKTHTFYASVSLGSIERQPETHEEFGELVRSKGQHANYEVTTISYEQQLKMRQGQWCTRFDSCHAVRGAPVAPDQELTMTIHGYRCLHPAWPETTLDFFYSERGLPNELDPTLAEEGEKFLEGVRIDGILADIPGPKPSTAADGPPVETPPEALPSWQLRQ